MEKNQSQKQEMVLQNIQPEPPQQVSLFASVKQTL